MKPDDQSQNETKYDYGTLFMMAIFLVTASQAAEDIQTPVGRFIRGVAIGLAAVCSVTGMVLYMQVQKRQRST